MNENTQSGIVFAMMQMEHQQKQEENGSPCEIEG